MRSRITGEQFDGGEHAYTDEERNQVVILADRMYRHQVLRVNYTTYDGRRDQDSINPRTHADVMVLNPGEDVSEDQQHPYWYARVYGIFHVNVQYMGPGPMHRKIMKMHVLWVRWFGRDFSALGGFSTRRLHRVGLLDGDGAFGFLDPELVIRGVHMIPAFHHLKIPEEEIVKTTLRCERAGEDQSDWRYYYVNQ